MPVVLALTAASSLLPANSGVTNVQRHREASQTMHGLKQAPLQQACPAAVLPAKGLCSVRLEPGHSVTPVSVEHRTKACHGYLRQEEGTPCNKHRVQMGN